MTIVIAGGGLAGISAGYFLSQAGESDFVIYEKESGIGGIARSVITPDGFTFDYASHILFTNSPGIRKLYSDLLADNRIELHRDAWIFSKEVFTRYPFQANTFGLPSDVIEECLLGFIKAQCNNNPEPNNFAEWVLNTFGSGIAKNFMFPYNSKVWKYTSSGYGICMAG